MAAAVTERIQVGYAVMLLALRQPAWAAKQIASLQSCPVTASSSGWASERWERPTNGRPPASRPAAAATHRRDLGGAAGAAGRSTHRPAERARPARRHPRTCRPDAPSLDRRHLERRAPTGRHLRAGVACRTAQPGRTGVHKGRTITPLGLRECSRGATSLGASWSASTSTYVRSFRAPTESSPGP